MLDPRIADGVAMIDWKPDTKGRLTFLDPEAGALYRLTDLADGAVQLAVFPDPSRRSCDRRAFRSNAEAVEAAGQRLAHDREVKALGRTTEHCKVQTPWGVAKVRTTYAEGVLLYATAETDLFRLSQDRNERIPETLRDGDGWYREDKAGAAVVLTFPEAFTAAERLDAEDAAQDWDEDLRAEFGLPSLDGPALAFGSP